MWELDRKEGWAPKNWCSQALVLEKTIESPLDCKEIKPVNSKGNQSWIFIGRTDADAKAPIFWPPAYSWSLPKLMSITLVMPSNHLILCRPLLLLPSIFPGIRVVSSELALHIRCPNYWSFSFSISPSNEYWGLISFRINWLDLLAIQGALKSLLQHHNLRASILWCSAFFMVQLSHQYMTTGKTIALTIQTFVGKVVSLLFNMLSRFVTDFLPKSKWLLISCCKWSVAKLQNCINLSSVLTDF